MNAESFSSIMFSIKRNSPSGRDTDRIRLLAKTPLDSAPQGNWLLPLSGRVSFRRRNRAASSLTTWNTGTGSIGWSKTMTGSRQRLSAGARTSKPRKGDYSTTVRPLRVLNGAEAAGEARI